MNNNKQRLYGLDLLKIILMFLIVVGHLFAHTGIRESTEFLSFKWCCSWSLQSLCVVSVDCFVLIAGYLGVKSYFNCRRLLNLWGNVLFYSIALFIILIAFGLMDFSYGKMLEAFFPVLSSSYWFFTCYIVMSIFAPFLNKLLKSLPAKYLKLLMLLLVLTFFILPLFGFLFPSFDRQDGYSLIQFVVLYLIGGALRLIEFRVKKSLSIIIISVNCLLIFLSKIALEIIVKRANLNVGTSLFYHYNTILVLINAVLLLNIFADISVKERWQTVLKILAPLLFSVYLLHDNTNVRLLLWGERTLAFLQNSSDPLFFIETLAMPLVIMIACLLIALLIKYFFRLIAKLPFVKFLDTKIKCVCNFIDNMFRNMSDGEING